MDASTLAFRLQGRRPRRLRHAGAAKASVALLLSPSDGGWEALFIRRAVHPLDPWSGHVGLPGGRQEPADPDPLAAALRETEEETGIALPRDALLGQLDDLEPMTPGALPVVVRPFVFALPGRPEVRPSPEVAAYFWADLARLRRSARTAQVLVRGRRRRVPAYRAGEHVIWGITGRIVSGLLERLFGDG